jgi:hypothetical protein
LLLPAKSRVSANMPQYYNKQKEQQKEQRQQESTMIKDGGILVV